MSYLEALKREKAGYEAQGKDDQAAEVAAEIKRVLAASKSRAAKTEAPSDAPVSASADKPQTRAKAAK